MERQTICDECKQKRTIGLDGLCHQCRVALENEGAEIDENGEIWTPGGCRL
jgi:hypothetical protein